VNVTQLRTVDRDGLTDRAGSLSAARVQEVLRGLALVFGLEEAVPGVEE
jgi:mRNA-degrading endonuclease toxin of MazEF toxin-antitoxin module